MMPISKEEWKELLLRLMPGRPALQEITARYIQTRAAADAAGKVVAEPSRKTPEWVQASEVFPKAAALYLQAGDSLASLALCNLWPTYGESVGNHILSLCDKWVETADDRAYITQSMERIHFAMMQMGQVAADPGRPKPAGLSPAARTALEASGWSSKGKGAAKSGQAAKAAGGRFPKSAAQSPPAAPASFPSPASRATPLIRPLKPQAQEPAQTGRPRGTEKRATSSRRPPRRSKPR